jgi:hypothetical protein
MNLETNTPKKPTIVNVVDDMDFDFKPITSGLGFHNNITTEVKPTFEAAPLLNTPSISMPNITHARKETQAQIYQNELSLFYGKELNINLPAEQVKEEKIIRIATKPQRVIAYMIDVTTILSFLGIMLTVMARLIEMDLVEVWKAYPGEMTPLVLTLFVGFYLIYFSVFEKTKQSTLGKSMVGITLVSNQNKNLSLIILILRSSITLLNVVSLGLFSYFDLQNKVCDSKVIKVD